MRLLLTALLGICLLASLAQAADQAALKDSKDKLSYSIGVDIGHRLKGQSIDVDPDILAKGIKDIFTGGKLLLTEQEVRDTLTTFQKDMIAKQKERAKVLGEKNKKEGEAYLEANRKKKGVKVLPSGLQYKVITEGKGKTPKATDTVTVNYKGTLIDGTEFDSSYKKGQPATFPVNKVIPGWTESLQLMKEGSKWQIVVPPALAYKEMGAGNMIGPDATLIFEIELISVKPAEAKPVPATKPAK
ncbi:MAG: FKBP-type peptidyl-prolyl cis-trans isomerase [Thermodesulfovibrionales bacterium]|jgi:FKBP-type peptidyl-prolyl cis-trans isomerase